MEGAAGRGTESGGQTAGLWWAGEGSDSATSDGTAPWTALRRSGVSAERQLLPGDAVSPAPQPASRLSRHGSHPPAHGH